MIHNNTYSYHECGIQQRIWSTILLLFCILFFTPTQSVQAQEISVTNFRYEQSDLTALNNKSIKDWNGDNCALIRVQTTQKGFVFDVGSIGIVKIEDNHVGEIWLWVPQGARHISIRHQQLGSLSNYDFPIAIQKGRTYIMEITHDQVFVTNYDDSKKQMLTIKVTPANATLSLNGMSVDLDAKGEASREMAHGQFMYKVEAEGYYPKEGIVIVNELEDSLVVDDLKPITGKLNVNVAQSSAVVFVDGKQLNRLSVEPAELQIGEHEVKVVLNGYVPETRVVTVKENQTTDIDVELKKSFSVKITPVNATLVINGTKIELDSNGEAICEMTHGQFMYKVEAEGYYPKEGQVIVNDNECSLVVNDLKPIMGKLSVHVNPHMAVVSVDGKQINQSTLEPVEFQIGSHEVKVSLGGYRTETRFVTIKESQTTDINVTLNQVADYKFTSTPYGATIYVDKERIGTAPCSKELTTGTYMIKATLTGYKDYVRSMKLDSSDPTVNVSLRKVFNYKNCVYIEGNIRAGAFVGVGATVGAYIHNVNVEASYLYGIGKSETVYWNCDGSKPLASSYSPATNISGRFGYGFPISTRFHLTPQIGFNFMKLTEKMESATTVTPASGANVASGVVSLRFSVAIVDYLAVSLSPEYSFAISKSKGYEALSSASSKIKGMGQGFNVKLGIAAFF